MTLHRAVQGGDVQRVRAMLRAGADPNAENAYGVTPLMSAVASKAHSLELTRDLLIHGADDRLGSLPLCFFVRDLQLRRWLNERHDYITRFHYFEEFSEDMLLAGLRSGAMLLSMRSAHGRSVLDLAAASATGNAAIVLRAAQPFSRESAELWPGFVRRRALELLVALRQISSAYGRQQLIDPLESLVLPACIGGRIALEQWRRALTCAIFIARLKCCWRSRRTC